MDMAESESPKEGVGVEASYEEQGTQTEISHIQRIRRKRPYVTPSDQVTKEVERCCVCGDVIRDNDNIPKRSGIITVKGTFNPGKIRRRRYSKYGATNSKYACTLETIYEDPREYDSIEPDHEEPKPEEPKPEEPKPEEPKPDEPKPEEPKPEEPKPVEPKPVEPKPVEPKPVEPKPVEPKPVEPKPVEPKPVEPKPVEPKPVEPKPKPTKTQARYIITSISDRRSFFRGEKPNSEMGRTWVTRYDKLNAERAKQEEDHERYLIERKLIEERLANQIFFLQKAKEDILVANNDDKLFGSMLLSINNEPEDILSVQEIPYLLKGFVSSSLEKKACWGRRPLPILIQKLIEEHNAVIFCDSTCVTCLKLLRIFRNFDVGHIPLRLDKMGAYGDRIRVYLDNEYSNGLPPNVFYHGMHLAFVKTSVSTMAPDAFEAVTLSPDAFDLIVIGSTPPGIAVVFEARKLGVKVCLVDSPTTEMFKPFTVFGKTSLLEPNISKKILYYLISLRKKATEMNSGCSSGSSGKIISDWMKLMHSARSLIKKLNLDNKKALHTSGSAYFNCKTKFIDRHRIELTNLSGQTFCLRSSYFVITTPMQHEVPEICGTKHCLSPDQIFTLPHSPGKTLIYGASQAAVEYACLLGSMGFPVTIMAPVALMKDFDNEMTKVIIDNMRMYGVEVISDCILKNVKLVQSKTAPKSKSEEHVSESDESFYRFNWNPLATDIKNNRRLKPGGPFRGRIDRAFDLDKVIRQAMLTSGTSAKVVKSILKVRSQMHRLKEVQQKYAPSRSPTKRRRKGKKKNKAARKNGDLGYNMKSQAASKHKQPKGVDRLRSNGRTMKDGKGILKKEPTQKDFHKKILALFLASTHEEKVTAILDFENVQKALLGVKLRNKKIEYGPHYSYNPKTGVGVYFPGGTALRLSKRSKYWKYLTPIVPSARLKGRKTWPFSVCRPTEEVLACLTNLKSVVSGIGVAACCMKDISLEGIECQTINDIMKDYNKEEFEISDKFLVSMKEMPAGERPIQRYWSYSFENEHKYFEEFIIFSLGNMEKTIKKMMLIGKDTNYKSQCLPVIKFLKGFYLSLEAFNMYIKWRIEKSNANIRNAKKCFKNPATALQYTNENFIIKLKCKLIQKTILNVLGTLDSLLTTIFLSACEEIVDDNSDSESGNEEINLGDFKLKDNKVAFLMGMKVKKKRTRTSKKIRKSTNNRKHKNKKNSHKKPNNSTHHSLSNTVMDEPLMSKKNKSRSLGIDGGLGTSQCYRSEENKPELTTSLEERQLEDKKLVTVLEQPIEAGNILNTSPASTNTSLFSNKELAHKENVYSKNLELWKAMNVGNQLPDQSGSSYAYSVHDVQSDHTIPLKSRPKIALDLRKTVKSQPVGNELPHRTGISNIQSFGKELSKGSKSMKIKPLGDEVCGEPHLLNTQSAGYVLSGDEEILYTQPIKNDMSHISELSITRSVGNVESDYTDTSSDVTDTEKMKLVPLRLLGRTNFKFVRRTGRYNDRIRFKRRPKRLNLLQVIEDRPYDSSEENLKNTPPKEENAPVIERNNKDRKDEDNVPEIKISDKLQTDKTKTKRSKINQMIEEFLLETSKIGPAELKCNFRNFLKVNFKLNFINKPPLSQRVDTRLTAFIDQLTARIKVLKSIKTNSLEAYRNRTFRDRNAFIEMLEKEQEMPPKFHRSSLYKYGVCDTISDRIGLMTIDPSRAISAMDLNILRKKFKDSRLYKMPKPTDVEFQSSIPIITPRVKAKFLKNIFKNIVNIHQDSGRTADVFSVSSYEPVVNDEYISSWSSSLTEVTPLSDSDSVWRLELPQEWSPESSIDFEATVNQIKQRIVHGIEDNVEEGLTGVIESADEDTSYQGEVHSLDVNFTESDVNLVHEIEETITDFLSNVMVNLEENGDFSQLNNNVRDETPENNEKENHGVVRVVSGGLEEATNVNLLNSKTDNSARNSALKPSGPGTPRSKAAKKTDGYNIKINGKKNIYTNEVSMEKDEKKKLMEILKQLKKSRRLHQDYKSQLQRLYSGTSHNALYTGIVPLDGRNQLEHQLNKKIKKIRDETKAFYGLIEELKQHKILKRIVKLYRDQKYPEKTASFHMEEKLFPNHPVYTVVGKYINPELERFKDDFNTVIIAGNKMRPAHDLNLTEIEVKRCHFNGKIYTNHLDQTSVPNIFALGECVFAWPYQSDGVASRYLTRRIFTEFIGTPEVQITTKVIQTFPNQYAFMGLSTDEARNQYEKVITYTGTFESLKNVLFPSTVAPSTLKFVCYEESPGKEKVVGIHFYNEQAFDVIQGYSTALKFGIYYYEIEDIIVVCPTNSEYITKVDMERMEYPKKEITEYSERYRYCSEDSISVSSSILEKSGKFELKQPLVTTELMDLVKSTNKSVTLIIEKSYDDDPMDVENEVNESKEPVDIGNETVNFTQNAFSFEIDKETARRILINEGILIPYEDEDMIPSDGGIFPPPGTSKTWLGEVLKMVRELGIHINTN